MTKLSTERRLQELCRSYHNSIKFVCEPNRADEERQKCIDFKEELLHDFERLQEIEKLSKQLLKKIPEWSLFGNWDTKRCIVCKGWLKEDPLDRHHHGHKPRCVREKLEKLLSGIT